MSWIKRNLFFVLGGFVALGLLGAAGFYNYTSLNRNEEKAATLKGLYETIQQISGDPKTSPGNAKVNKTEQAREQELQLSNWLAEARAYFKPIAPIPSPAPNHPVTSETFAPALNSTISALLHEATNANVALPPDCFFSFKAESSLVQFAPGSLDALAAQLGEVKTLSEILFAAGINEFGGIQRLRVSDDDASGPQSDYLAMAPVDNSLAVITPYVVSFKCFGPEIARLLSALAASEHGFLVKSINVQTINGVGGQAASPFPYGAPGQPGVNEVPVKGGLVTVLKEGLLQVTMEIDILKLHPKN